MLKVLLVATRLDGIPPDDDDYEVGHIHVPPEDTKFEAKCSSCFDGGTNALGTLKIGEYMILPSNWSIPKCPVSNIGGGLNEYNPGQLAATAVYALAKAQAFGFGWDNEKSIKWALLRMEAFIAGWFDNQKLTMYKPAPPNFKEIFAEDVKEIDKHIETAWTLCSFLPFVAEFYFRAYGTNYQNTDDREEYVLIAEKLATVSLVKWVTGYMDRDTLFGSVLSWIDVKRPMGFLRDPKTCCRYSKVFQVRRTAAPAGQHLIALSVAIIRSLEKGKMWDGIKKAGGYDDEKLMSVFKKISADPWKYHTMHQVYGVKELSVQEVNEVEEAKKLAILFAPVLQAYFDVSEMENSLGKSEELKKYAQANKELYSRAVGTFEATYNHETFEDVFRNKVFKPEKVIKN